MISQEALNEFKEIWKEEFGYEPDNFDATQNAVSLLTLFDKIYRPIKKDWLKNENENVKKFLQKSNL